MDKHIIAARLDQLLTEGQNLVGRSDLTPTGISDLWYAKAIDTLTLFLPDSSDLLRVFKELRDRQQQNDRELPQALNVIRIAADMNRARRSDELLADLRHDVQTIISEIYVKSWWFYVPVAILAIAALFAALGVVDIRGTKINVQQVADEALQKARMSIDEHRRSVEDSIDRINKQVLSRAEEAKNDAEEKLEGELKPSVAELNRALAEAAKNRVTAIENEKAPKLEFDLGAVQQQLKTVEMRLKEADGQLNRLKSSLNDIESSMKRVDSAEHTGVLNGVSVFLNRSRSYVIAELVVNTVALAFLVAILIRFGISSWRRRHH